MARVPLTLLESQAYLSKLAFERRIPMDRAAGDEADVQAPQPQAGQQARVPGADEDAGRTQDAQPAEAKGSRSDCGEGRRQVTAEEPLRSERFPRGARIHRSVEIRRLLERGKRERTSSLDVYFGASPAACSRLGLIVPKHGRRIVDRNLLKRRLREIGRRRLLPDLDARGVRADVLIRARERAYGVEFDALAREIEEAVEALCSDAS